MGVIVIFFMVTARPDFDNNTGGFVAGNDWERGVIIMLLDDLKVGMAEACGVDLDEEFVVFWLGGCNGDYLVGFVMLLLYVC